MSKMLRLLHIALIAITISFLACTPEDTASPAPEDFFVKYYGTNDSEVMIDVQAYDRGYLLLGSTQGAGDKDFLLIKTDSLGSKLWEKKIGFTYNNEPGNDTPSEMIIYDNEHVAIIGTTEFTLASEGINATRAFVALVNVMGSEAIVISDNLIFPVIPSGALDATIRDVNSSGSSLLRPLANGQLENALILLGSSDFVFEKTNQDLTIDIQDIYMTKIIIGLTGGSATATVADKWPQYFGFNGFDAGVRVLQSQDENFNVISTTDNATGTTGGGLNIGFDIVTFDGVVGNNLTFGNPGDTDDVATDLSVNGGRITILGNSSAGNAFILEIESNGKEVFGIQEIKFDGLFGTTTPGNIGNGIVKLNDGDYFITGQVTNYTDQVTSINKQSDVVLYKIDQAGQLDVNSVKAYGGIGNDIGQAIIQNANGSLMIGATMDFQGSTTMMSLIKTNSKGELAR